MAATIIGTVLAAGALYAVSRLFAPDIPKRDLRRTAPATAIQDARWILGRARTGGALAFFQQEDSQTLWLAMAISEGPCDAIERMWVNGQEVAFTRFGNTLTATDAILPEGEEQTAEHRYNANGLDRLKVYEYFAADGSQGSEIRAACSDFTDEHLGYGLSWVAVQLYQPGYGGDTIPDPFWRRIPDLQFLVRGIRLTWPGQATPTWTENAAALRYWFETVRRGIPASVIDASSFRAAFNTCAAMVSFDLPPAYANQGLTSRFPRYTINGATTAGDDAPAVAAEMDQAWQGNIAESGGILHFNAGMDRTVSFNLTESDTLAIGAAQTGPSIQDRVNAVFGSIYQSRDHDYLEWDGMEVRDTDAFNRDGTQHFPLDLGQRIFVDSPIRAAWLMYIALREARGSMRLPITLRPGTEANPFAYLGILPGQWVTLSNIELGFTSKLFQVSSVTINPDATVSLLLEEQFRGNFAENLILPPLRPRNINIGRRFVPEVEGLALDEIAEVQQDGTVLIVLYAAWASDAFRTEVQARMKDLPATLQTALVERAQRAGFPGVMAGQTYEVRARHINRFEVAGEWTDWIEDVIDGDLTPPLLPTGLMLEPLPGGFITKWAEALNMAGDPLEDYLHTEVWSNTTDDFATASRIVEVDATEWPQLGYRTVETVYVWIRHVDTSHNLGGTAMGSVETGVPPVDYEDPTGMYTNAGRNVICYFEGEHTVTGSFTQIGLANRLIGKTLDIRIRDGSGLHAMSSYCPVEDLPTSGSVQMGFEGGARLNVRTNSGKSALMVQKGGGADFTILCILGLRSPLETDSPIPDVPKRLPLNFNVSQCGAGASAISISGDEITVNFPNPADIFGQAFGGGLLGQLGRMVLGRSGLNLGFSDSFLPDAASTVCVDIAIGGVRIPILGDGAGGLPSPTSRGQYILGNLPASIAAAIAAYISDGTLGEVCVYVKGDVPTGVIPPRLEINNIESINEKETATFTASLSGGEYDAVTYRWEVVSGGGTLTDR